MFGATDNQISTAYCLSVDTLVSGTIDDDGSSSGTILYRTCTRAPGARLSRCISSNVSTYSVYQETDKFETARISK